MQRVGADDGGAQLIRAGEGLETVRSGTRRGHTYHLLAAQRGPRKIFEPFLVTFNDKQRGVPGLPAPGRRNSSTCSPASCTTATAGIPTSAPGRHADLHAATWRMGPSGWKKCRSGMLSMIIYANGGGVRAPLARAEYPSAASSARAAIFEGELPCRDRRTRARSWRATLLRGLLLDAAHHRAAAARRRRHARRRRCGAPRAADAEPQNWFTGGRDQDGTYYSPLADINADNVERAGIRLGTTISALRSAARRRRRSSSTESCTPPAPGATSTRSMRPPAGRCGATIRRPRSLRRPEIRAAIWSTAASRCGRARSMSPRSTGGCMRSTPPPAAKIWEADTITDHKLPYSSTGAPQIAGDVVVIGNGGSRHGTRRRARLRVRLRFGDRRLQMALLHRAAGRRASRSRIPNSPRPRKPGTRTATRNYKGGGTVWDGIAYDPELNLVYFGTAQCRAL